MFLLSYSILQGWSENQEVGEVAVAAVTKLSTGLRAGSRCTGNS